MRSRGVRGVAGIISNRDVEFVSDPSTPLSAVMSTDLVVGHEGCTLMQANALLRESKKGCVLRTTRWALFLAA